jgi:DNA-binding MarR family transcriptional regulator
MDKRISVVTLTDEGKRLGKTLLHTYNEFLSVMFSDLSDEEQENLYRLLDKLKRPIIRK